MTIRRIQNRRGTADEWTAANPTLANGELGFESNTRRFKIGNGATPWNGLTYNGLERSGDSLTGRLSLGTKGEIYVAITNRPAADAPSTYPSGLSMFGVYTENLAGFPDRGTVFTVRHTPFRTYQELITIGTPSRRYFRTGYVDANGTEFWNDWMDFVPTHARARVTGAAIVAIHNTLTRMDLDSTLRADTEYTVDLAANEIRVSRPGLYRCTAWAHFGTHGTGHRTIHVEKNAGSVIARDQRSAASSGGTSVYISMDEPLVAGDAIYGVVFQNSGVDLRYGFNTAWSGLAVTRLG